MLLPATISSKKLQHFAWKKGPRAPGPPPETSPDLRGELASWRLVEGLELWGCGDQITAVIGIGIARYVMQLADSGLDML